MNENCATNARSWFDELTTNGIGAARLTELALLVSLSEVMISRCS